MNPKLAVYIAIAAFGTGVGTTWFFFHEKYARTPDEPPVFTVVATTKDAGAVPPDVSQMSAAQGALTLGNWNYDRKNWKAAIENYRQAIAAGLDKADVRTDLGNAFRFSEEPQKALEQYRIAQKQNPRHENSFFNTATLYTGPLHDTANAILAWREYLQRFPDGEKAATARQFLLDAAEKPAAGK